MPIPVNITGENVLQAIQRIQLEGVPPYRGFRKWAVRYGNNLYPCKLLISWANVYPNGEELDPNPNNFQTDMATQYLANLEFIVVRV